MGRWWRPRRAGIRRRSTAWWCGTRTRCTRCAIASPETANCCYDLHRARNRRPADSLGRSSAGEEEDSPARDVADPALGPEDLALKGEVEQVVQAGLLALPEDQRLAVVLCDLYGLDYQGIAEMTGVELGTVKSRINRGRRRLRDHLLQQRELLPSAYRLREE